MFRNIARAFAVPLATLILLLFIAAAQAQPGLQQHMHAERDAGVHQDFYMKWDRPDYDGNCCNKKDCYPTAIRRIGDQYYALTRTLLRDATTGTPTGEYYLNDPADLKNWVQIPSERLEQNQIPGAVRKSSVNGNDYTMREPYDSPDGRSHVCLLESGNAVRADGSQSNIYVLCAVLGEQG